MDTCVVIPIYNHKDTIEEVVKGLSPLGLACLVVDDGSDAATRTVLDALPARYPWVEVVHRAQNGGRGAALRDGYRAAAERGFSHALQIDADGQHDFAAIPRITELARAHPDAIVTGVPVFDASAPAARRIGRKLTTFWVRINTLSSTIQDAMCGFRVYPLGPIMQLSRRASFGSRMEFDPEILVRAVWAGVPVVSMPTNVTYPSDGVSHFKMWRDNVRISWMHTRLFFGMLWRAPLLLARRLRT